MIAESKIDELVDRIIKGYKPEKVILFGSYANGTPNEDSDIDLMVLKNSDLSALDRTVEVRGLLRGIGIPVDLFVYTDAELEEAAKIPYSVEQEVLKSGKVLYMDLSKQDLIIEWLNKANEDLAIAKVIQMHIPEYKDSICFHCQQAVEKYLKAYLINLDMQFKKTHDLSLLLDLLSEKIEIDDSWYKKASILQFYAVDVRYPLGRFTMNDIRDKEAILVAQEFRQWIEDELKKGLPD
jgi:HEPN domain-containing protein/predicted nucleotidyltransferase